MDIEGYYLILRHGLLCVLATAPALFNSFRISLLHSSPLDISTVMYFLVCGESRILFKLYKFS